MCWTLFELLGFFSVVQYNFGALQFDETTTVVKLRDSKDRAEWHHISLKMCAVVVVILGFSLFRNNVVCPFFVIFLRCWRSARWVENNPFCSGSSHYPYSSSSVLLLNVRWCCHVCIHYRLPWHQIVDKRRASYMSLFLSFDFSSFFLYCSSGQSSYAINIQNNIRDFINCFGRIGNAMRTQHNSSHNLVRLCIMYLLNIFIVLLNSRLAME